MEKMFVIKKQEYTDYHKNGMESPQTICVLEDFTKMSAEEFNNAQTLLKLFNKCVENWNSNKIVKERYKVEIVDAYEEINDLFNKTLNSGKEVLRVSLETFLKKYVETHYPDLNQSNNIEDVLTEISNQKPQKKQKIKK